MTKLKITFEVSLEYEADPENYPGCSSPEEMLAVDLANAEDDPFLMLGDSRPVWKIAGAVIE